MNAHDDWTTINVAAPLPLAVAGALMQAIGAVWPTAVVQTGNSTRSMRGDTALVMRVDPHAIPKTLGKRRAAQIAAEAVENAHGIDFVGFRDDVLSLSTPEDLSIALGHACQVILAAHEDAVNYLEFEVTHQVTHQRYVISAARSKDQTPHALRTKAENELADLRAQVAALAARADTEDPDALARDLRALADAHRAT